MLPLDILRIIQQYLKYYDYKQLLNTNQTIFKQCKYKTAHYHLFADSRKKDEDLFEKFKKEKLEKVRDRVCFLKDKCEWISIHLIQPISPDLILQSIVLINSFSNIYHVHLERIWNNSVSGLIGIKIIEISESPHLISIEFIPGLKRLILYSLLNLAEIPSDYRNIPEINITSCPKLNLQGLGNHNKVCVRDNYLNAPSHSECLLIFRNVQYLDVFTRQISVELLRGVPMFTNLLYLKIRCNSGLFDCASCFPNIRFLSISYAVISSEISFSPALRCAQFDNCSFDDLSIVKDVKELMFYGCRGRGFQDVSVLSNADKLALVGISELCDVSSLGGVRELTIERNVNVKDISRLGQVHRLRIEVDEGDSLEGLGKGNSEVVLTGFQKNVDFSPLRSIYKVTLMKCSGLVDGRDLINVQHLSIVNCENFNDTSALGMMKSLCVVDCTNLKRLVGLEDVPYIHLERCGKLEDIQCLGKQQSLIIFQCRRLRRLKNNAYSIFPEIPFVRIDVEEFSLHEINIFKKHIPNIFDFNITT